MNHKRNILVPAIIAFAVVTASARLAGAEEPRLEVLDQLVAVDNVCAWPKLTVLPDGTLAAALFNHPSHQRAPGNIELWVSEDQGENWQYRGTPAKREPGGTRVNHAIGLANNGHLLVIAGGKIFAERKLVRPWVCRSTDGGKTWEVREEAFPTGPDGLRFVPFGNIERAANEDLCVAAFVFRAHEKPRRDTLCLLRSNDDGKTWHIGATMADRVHNETDVCHLGGGHWLAAARSLKSPPGSTPGHSVDLLESTDDGKTWRLVRSLGEGGQHPADLLKLRDGRVVLTLGDRRPGHFGVVARISADRGKTWSAPVQIAHSAHRDCGYPSSVELPDGRVLTAFYSRATEDHPRYHMGTVCWKPPPAQNSKARERAPSQAKNAEGQKRYDLVVYGGTPGGIACAVRGAREGLRVLLVNHTAHLGGMLANGLGVMDTVYDGPRAPLYDELCAAILEHYRSQYGPHSPQYRTAKPGPRLQSSDRLTFEPSVAERVVTDMVRKEPSLDVLLEHYPVACSRQDRQITRVVFRRMNGKDERSVQATEYADASYEADLAAVAGVPYRVGREPRQEYIEPHAGAVFTRIVKTSDRSGGWPRAAVTGELNLRPFRATQGPLLPGSTGEGDRAIQAYNFRLCLTDAPGKRRMPEKPDRYNRDAFFTIRERWSMGGCLAPNRKISWNVPLLIAGNHDYPEADWPKRAAITARHRDFALGLLYFLQHDPVVPSDLQAEARRWGLAKDEFTENDNIPYEMYVRETRRIVGRATFTEHGAVPAEGLDRAPPHADAVAITEWPLDSHSCTLRRVPGSDAEGKVLLTEATRPGQVPFRCLLPREMDNLLVPVCLSATHVGWGTIRLEPTWMQLGESAGYAAALAVRSGSPVAEIDVAQLQRTLIRAGSLLTFFNDVKPAPKDPAYRAVQYLGTRGFFANYDARLAEPLSTAVAQVWASAACWREPSDSRATQLAESVYAAEQTETPPVTAAQFADLLQANRERMGHLSPEVEARLAALSRRADRRVFRGDACALVAQYHGGRRVNDHRSDKNPIRKIRGHNTSIEKWASGCDLQAWQDWRGGCSRFAAPHHAARQPTSAADDSPAA